MKEKSTQEHLGVYQSILCVLPLWGELKNKRQRKLVKKMCTV